MFGHKRIALIEPLWGENLLLSLNGLLNTHQYLATIMPLASDIFVFFYPIFLVGLYLYGIAQTKTKDREAALFIFRSGWGAMAVNFIIKLIFTKTRPDVVLELLFENREGLVLESLPKNTFPSDHAAMAFAIASATMLLGIKQNKKYLVYLGVLLYIMACIMAVGRIMIGIHRPTDIIAGTIVGCSIPLIIRHTPLHTILQKYFVQPLIKLQEIIRGYLGNCRSRSSR